MELSNQLEYERELSERGAELYYETQDALREKGRASDSDAVQAIFKHNTAKLIVVIDAIIRSNTNVSPYKKRLMDWLELIPVAKLAYFAQYTVMRVVDDDNKELLGLRYVCQRIGEMVETEARCITFEYHNKEYYDSIQKSFKKDKVSSYNHKRQVMVKKMNDLIPHSWEKWGMNMRVGIGQLLLRALMTVFKGLIYTDTVWLTGAKSKHVLCTSVEFDEWLADYEHMRGCRSPYRMPTKIPPQDWTNYTDGGYYTKQLQYVTPFVDAVGKAHNEFIQRFKPAQHMQAANKLQRVPHMINKRMVDIMEYLWENSIEAGIPRREPLEMPEPPAGIEGLSPDEMPQAKHREFLEWKADKKQAHRDEVKRRALVRSCINVLNAGKELRDWDEFYYVWSACFRGRLYQATAALHQQGHETARCLLLFKRGKPLGNLGLVDLAAHGGNLFGIKGDYKNRAKWVVENREFIKKCAEDWQGLHWKDADKPMQFLAWCFEWEKCGYGSKPETVSHWMTGIDGTNNGLQHLSAMARDPHGAYMTNLTPETVKQDAYQVVADAFLRKLQAMEDGVAELWLKAAPGRDLAKMPMMVLVYGATKQTCRKHCIDWVHKHKDRFDVHKSKLYDIAQYGSEILWAAIEEEIPLAIRLMAWLQANVHGRFVSFISPVHFPVYQYYMKAKEEFVNSAIAGGITMTCYNLDDAEATPNAFRQRNGIVPNLVHSLDSSHLVMTVNAFKHDDISCVHDEYLTHACDIQELKGVVREQFYELHKTDVLAEWARQQGIAPEYLPERGTWKIEEVLSSVHLFE